MISIFAFIVMRINYKKHKSNETKRVYNELKYKLENASEKELNFIFFGDFSEKYSRCHDQLTLEEKQELLKLKDSLFKVFKRSTYEKKP